MIHLLPQPLVFAISITRPELLVGHSLTIIAANVTVPAVPADRCYLLPAQARPADALCSQRCQSPEAEAKGRGVGTLPQSGESARPSARSARTGSSSTAPMCRSLALGQRIKGDVLA